MASTGLDRFTGLPLSGFAHVVQCVDVIFSTRLGDMVMLRWFGCGLVELLGRRATQRNLDLYKTLIALGISTWEPRLAVVKVLAEGNTDSAVRLGRLRFQVLCHYRPNALKGDYRIEGGLRRIGVGADNDNNAIRLTPLAA